MAACQTTVRFSNPQPAAYLEGSARRRRQIPGRGLTCPPGQSSIMRVNNFSAGCNAAFLMAPNTQRAKGRSAGRRWQQHPARWRLAADIGGDRLCSPIQYVLDAMPRRSSRHPAHDDRFQRTYEKFRQWRPSRTGRPRTTSSPDALLTGG